MKTLRVAIAILLVSIFFYARADAAPIVGFVQTFDAPHGWVIGVGPMLGTPIPVPTALGGPAGPADPYLLLESSGGTGPGSRLTAQNCSEWAGNYTGAGIGAIEMDVNNFGPDDLFLRLLFVDFGAMGPLNAAFTTNPIFVPAGGGWEDVAFAISPADLTPLLGTVALALANVDELRIFHNTAPFFIPGQNPPSTAALGVDNITAAVAVPEPATIALLVAGALGLGVRRRT